MPLLTVFFPHIFIPCLCGKSEAEMISVLLAFVMSLLCYVLFCMDIVKCKMCKLKKIFYIIFLSPITISILLFFIPIIPLIFALFLYCGNLRRKKVFASSQIIYFFTPKTNSTLPSPPLMGEGISPIYCEFG